MDSVIQALRTFVIWEANAVLAIAYTGWEHAAAILTLGAFLVLLRGVPPSQNHQRPWIAAVAAIAIMAALLAPAPVPFILTVLAGAAVAAVRTDSFGPDMLRWRATAAVALYALAGLAYVAYSRYLDSLDAVSWARALGGAGEAQQALAQGRAFVDTLARWGLWLIVPLGTLSMLVQGLFVHPPAPGRPEQIVSTVRTRGHGH
jgi:hypothetical protein